MDVKDLTALTTQTENVIDTLTSAVLGSVTGAAERVALAAGVVQVNQRMGALAGILEAIVGAKNVLAARLAEARGSMRILLERQMDLLVAQEAAVLERAGVAPAAARAAIGGEGAPPERREGARQRPRLNGNGTTK